MSVDTSLIFIIRTATVEFRDPESAVKAAIEFNGQILDGHEIFIELFGETNEDDETRLRLQKFIKKLIVSCAWRPYLSS